MAQLLLKNDAQVDLATNNGMTPLFIACKNGRAAFVELLLDRGATIDQPMQDGSTPLFIACGYGHDAVVQLLLDRGAEWNRARGDGGWAAADLVCSELASIARVAAAGLPRSTCCRGGPALLVKPP